MRIHTLVVLLSSCAALALDPSNPDATVATRRLLNLLVEAPDRPTHSLISGQYVGHGPQVTAGYTTEVVNLHRDTDAWVTLIGADYALGSLDDKWFAEVNATAKQHWAAGGLVSLCLCSVNNPATGGDSSDKSVHDLQALVTPGTAANTKWLAVLDKVAAALTVLRDAGVVVLWRPLHEMNLPAAFWWADAPPADYVALWRHMHRYFSVEKKLDNLLWVFAPNGVTFDNGTKPPADYYPGADVVDVVGLDWYSDEPAKFAAGGYDALRAMGKPFALTELGPELGKAPTPHDLATILADVRAQAPRASYFMTWTNYGGKILSLGTLKNSKAALADPSVMNCQDFDYTPTDGGTNPHCVSLESLKPSAGGCGCDASAAGAVGFGLLVLSTLRARRAARRPHTLL